MEPHNHSKAALENIWNEVPVDYYQKGVLKNPLQAKWHFGKLRRITRIITESKKGHSSILDVGCASGWFLNEIAKQFPSALCTGVDVYEDAIAYGKKMYKHLNLQTADGHKLPFKDESFDIVICCEVLEHVVDPGVVLSEIKRVLKKDGVAVIEMDSGNFLFKLAWYFWTHVRHGVWEHAHIQVFDAKKLATDIKKAGFTIEKTKYFNFYMAVVYRAVKK